MTFKGFKQIYWIFYPVIMRVLSEAKTIAFQFIIESHEPL